ncbi:CAP domain-containing protein [Streptomyces phaeoluteigriseus]|uniref:CAP domain-containing protein n=1 Tax=Streptomyces phaeoluteigriseus TaxID=114686 RepID=A0ABY4Z7R9_9ACTN|nr:CAP domain-containing protein [Streptomyces phaeoluteigriseus]USQ85006.1 CAP domain-containing protein [Streptomyces phaeoluteigriseus]
MSELVAGANVALPEGALAVRVSGPFDVCALVTDDSGKVGGDGDFVFYNQPTAPGAGLRGGTLTLEPARLRAGATRVTVVVSAVEPGTRPGGLPAPTLQVTDRQGRPLARFTPAPARQETVLLLAEVYRRGGVWKLRALGQGYADGLAGLARDFGVEVADEGTAAQGSPAPRTAAAPAPASVRAPDPERFLGPVNSARAAVGSPPVSLDARLVSAARAHVTAMTAAGRLGTMGADGVSVHQRVTAAGFRYLAVGEHLVSGPRTSAEFLGYCLRTDQARRTLHDPAFTHAGLARAEDGRTGDVLWTALWASPLTPAGLAGTEAEVVDRTNRERARAGLRPLAVDPLLATAARAHSADMVARSFYSHTSPEGGRPWDRAAAAGSARRTIGENIACGQRSPAEVVEGWMNSPGHRANILKPAFTHIGVGFAGGGPSGTYWTQLFGA